MFAGKPRRGGSFRTNRLNVAAPLIRSRKYDAAIVISYRSVNRAAFCNTSGAETNALVSIDDVDVCLRWQIPC